MPDLGRVPARAAGRTAHLGRASRVVLSLRKVIARGKLGWGRFRSFLHEVSCKDFSKSLYLPPSRTFCRQYPGGDNRPYSSAAPGSTDRWQRSP